MEAKERKRFHADVLHCTMEGVVNGFLRVQRTLTLSASGDEFSGPAMADFCDANWNIVFSTTTDVKGKMLETP